MFDFNKLLVANGFIPHGHCYLWKPGLVGLHVASDLLIGLAYLSISITLVRLVQRIRLPFHGMFLAFGLFIAACGATHFMEVLTLWHPVYWLSGAVKVVTAFASVITAVLLPPLIPQVVGLVQLADLAEERRVQLEKANSELANLYERVKELDRLKTKFFANVSHELRTPLSLVLGTTERLLSQGGLADLQTTSLETIDRNAQMLLKYVNDLLDIAKLEAGKMSVNYSQVDLVGLVRLTAAYFETVAQDRRVEFLVTTPASLPGQVDPEKLQRVFLNLLSNAFKFVPDGGEVGCRLEQKDDRVRITVEDSGPGVPLSLRESIFERFQQGVVAAFSFGSRDAARQAGGTGLGRAIAKEFVELHHGTITVNDAPSGGASFTVELPLSAPPGAADSVLSADEKATATPPSGDAVAQQILAALRTATAPEEAALALSEAESDPAAVRPLILVVEDNPDMQQFIRETLTAEYRVITASNGQQGLEQAIALYPDLILTDLMMPQMNGDALVRELRSHPELNATPIVLLTAKADNQLQIDLLREGAQDYLLKPFSVEELQVRVENLIAVKQIREVLQQELASQSQDVALLTTKATLSKQELQQALAALRQSETHFRRVAESNMIGILFWDAQGRITEANDTLLKLIGYDREELRAGQISWRDMTPIEYQYLDDQAMAELTQSGSCNPFEKEYIRRDGSRVPVLIGAAMLEESVDRGVAFVLDITERKQAEADLQKAYAELEQRVEQRTQELSQANAKLQAEIAERQRTEAALAKEQEFLNVLLDNLNAGIVACDAEGVLTLFNRATREFHGLPEQPIQAEQWADCYDLYLPDGESQMAIADIPLFRALQGERLHNIEMKIIPKQGKVRDCLASGQAIFDSQGKKLGAVVVMHDVSEAKRDEAVRKQAEAQIRTLNAELEQRVIERTAQLEAANQTKDQLLVREQAARAEAESANRMKDEFLATLSHELRTPLNAILGWAQLLRNRNFDSATTARALETIERNARSQSQLIGDILEVSRIIRGKVRLSTRPLQLIPVAEAALDSLRPAADAKAIQIIFHSASNLDTITGDFDRLQQVFWNLLSNAIKFTPVGGRVEVRLWAEDEHQAAGSLSAISPSAGSDPATPLICIQVSDTGQGIAPDFLPRVFDRFRQEEGGIDRTHGGLGLGLAIVRHLVELHGGTVSADSAGLGQGATFTIKLPRVAKSQQAESTGEKSPALGSESKFLGFKARSLSLTGLRILVVDDEIDTREFLAVLLENCGATVSAVASVAAAMDVLTTTAIADYPDVIVSDVGMPEQDGYALIRQVRAIAAERHITLPAVALTAYAGANDRAQLLLAGFQIHVPKPVDADELVAVVANLAVRTEGSKMVE
jgi:PAS domain S-box-containing protein